MSSAPSIKFIDPREFDFAVSKLREFFRDKMGFVETHVQSGLDILAACEDPFNIATFDYAGDVWPMSQTGQMRLEQQLLTDPSLPGLFCVTTSYRQEPDPKPGRHDLIFPMFEFETHGDMVRLEQLERELLEFLGFGPVADYPAMRYERVAQLYGVRELNDIHEADIQENFGNVFFLKNFPEYTSPFWNMKREGDYAKKIDVILCGMETIGSAERSIDPEDMRLRFHTISDGKYAKRLFGSFRRDRVLAELDNFLALPMIPRCGGGIGMTRMIRALKLANLMK